MNFRFLHLADLHLDSAYGGTPATVERLRRASLEALAGAADFALEAHLDAVLIAGDAFDDDRLGYESRAVLRRELTRLSEGGVTVVYVTGNHDPGAASGRAASLRAQRSLSRPGPVAPIHVMLDGTPRVLRLWNRAGTDVAQVVAAGHASSRVTDNLARSILAAIEREPLAVELPSIGLLHTQVGTAAGADGHQPYAPCTVGDLMACDLDYWALGHVHVRGRVDPTVPAYYPGNLQGRNAREAGPRGGLLVELDADGMETEPEFLPFAPVEFFRCFFRCGDDIDRDAEPEEVAERIAAALDDAASRGAGPVARELVVRVDVEGGLDPRTLPEDFAAAVRDELQGRSGPVFGEILEVQIARARAGDRPPERNDPPAAGVNDPGFTELIETIERTPSALRAALVACRERDRRNGTRLERTLLERLSTYPRA